MFRNFPIRTKLIIALLGPLLVLAVLALVGIRQNQAESDRAERSTAFARLAAGLAPLTHQLQAERSLSISYIDSGRKRWRPELDAQRREVDQAAATYRDQVERLSADDELLEERIQYGLSELGRLGEQRKAIDRAPIVAAELAVAPGIELHEEEGEEELEHATKEGHGPLDTPGKALEQYTDTVSDLLDINGEIAPRSNNAALLKGVAASVALSRAKDFADAQRSLLQNVYAADHFGANEFAKLSAWSRPSSSTPPSSTPTPPRPSTSSSRRPWPAPRSTRSAPSWTRPSRAPTIRGSASTRSSGSTP